MGYFQIEFLCFFYKLHKKIAYKTSHAGTSDPFSRQISQGMIYFVASLVSSHAVLLSNPRVILVMIVLFHFQFVLNSMPKILLYVY